MNYDFGIIAILAFGVSLGGLIIEIGSRGVSVIFPVAESSML